MAFIDYGCVVLKNGKLMTAEMFGDMKEMVGWEDTDKDVYEEYSSNGSVFIPIKLKDNFFAYIGDDDCTLGFYKEQIVIVERHNDGTFSYDHEFFNCTNYTWSKWEKYIVHGGSESRIRVTKRNGYYVCRWDYKGNKYKVYFGYGVDIGLYKKCRMVNYFRTPAYLFKTLIIQPIKDKIWEYQINH